MSIKLENGMGSTRVFHSSERDLKSHDTYVSAIVKEGTWIMYSKKDYNKELQNGSQDNKIKVLFLSSGDASIEATNGSMFHVSSTEGAITMFEFQYYGGDNKVYTTEEEDLSTPFENGAYSAIVGKLKDWKVFSSPRFDGERKELEKGKLYATADSMAIPSAKSIKPQ